MGRHLWNPVLLPTSVPLVVWLTLLTVGDRDHIPSCYWGKKQGDASVSVNLPFSWGVQLENLKPNTDSSVYTQLAQR